MLAFQAFHLAAYHFAHGTFQPTATSSALGCSEVDSLLGGGPGLVNLNAALDVCFDAQFSSCSHAEVQRLWMRASPNPTLALNSPNNSLNTLTLPPTLTP